MMKDSIKTDVTTAKVTTAEIISGVLGIAMIALGYYMATEMFGMFKALTMAMTSPFIILFFNGCRRLFILQVPCHLFLKH